MTFENKLRALVAGMRYAASKARGMTTTDASAKALAEKAYKRWLAGRLA